VYLANATELIALMGQAAYDVLAAKCEDHIRSRSALALHPASPPPSRSPSRRLRSTRRWTRSARSPTARRPRRESPRARRCRFRGRSAFRRSRPRTAGRLARRARFPRARRTRGHSRRTRRSGLDPRSAPRNRDAEMRASTRAPPGAAASSRPSVPCSRRPPPAPQAANRTVRDRGAPRIEGVRQRRRRQSPLPASWAVSTTAPTPGTYL